MKYCSTRNSCAPVSADIAIRSGLAPDGGLYMPERLPRFEISDFDGATDIAATAKILLSPFFWDSSLGTDIEAICQASFNFSAPLITPNLRQPDLHVLELFHGPTGAFKDFGARFLLSCLDQIATINHPVTVLAATSGDTGGAVGCATQNAKNARAVILYPRGRISKFQEQQLCCWGNNVRAFRVNGDFDDCQAMVKSAFSDQSLSARHGLTSANSISIGRLLPQMSYWAWVALERYKTTATKPGLIIPTGNLGNAVAAVLARAVGLPIGPIILATNSNATLTDWKRSGQYHPRASIATIANAMDVGTPSNFERLTALDPAGIEAVESIDDAQIRHRITTTDKTSGYVACPHTATAFEAYDRLSAPQKSSRPWIIAATAHPYKFSDVINPLINAPCVIPPPLAEVETRVSQLTDIEATLPALQAQLDGEQSRVD
jgi:threonine synthase